MANDLNSCSFIGRLGQDPETRFLPSGDSVTNISLAVGWKTKEKEGVEWVPVVFFGRLAEVVSEYLRKGSQVYVSGRFRTQSWEKDGQKRYRSEIVADRMQMLGGRQDREARQSAAPSAPADYFGDSDIPF